MFTKGGRLDLPRLEEEVLRLWRNRGIFKKSLAARADAPSFIFYEGPPTANGKPGLHHVIGRVFKDVVLRYKTMRGFRVERRAGWDTHGLPVEIEVEKELGLKSKSEIERYGIARFNAKAKESVWKYRAEWERMTERIGFWVDMERPYVTYDSAYIDGLWGIIKTVNDRGLLYKGYKVVPWCTRCGTALSSHELAQGYEEVSDKAVYVKFRLAGQDAQRISRAGTVSIVAWTTTPWTLPGNVALAVNPAHQFVAAHAPSADSACNEQELLVVEKNAAARLGLIAIREIAADDLLGLAYEPLFNVPPLRSERSYKIYPADFVSAADGTGVVHTAVMYGEDDYALGHAASLPEHHTVDERGYFTGDIPELAGLRAKSKTTEEKIIAQLAAQGHLLKAEHYTHDYPFCWRCKTPIIYYATDSWFIAMSTLRAELLAANAGVNWRPEHIKEGRFGEWLREAKDWALSRARYWGTPLPVWECIGCRTYEVIGSLAELEARAGCPPKNEAGEIDLHRPFIDALAVPCRACAAPMTRVPEVLDVWFDSGAMPFASGEFGAGRYPAEYICEAVDQTRGWFYTLLAIGVATGNGSPYKNVICYAHLLDKHGKKMSKSQGNIVEPMALIARHGIDALRWQFYTSAIVDEPQRFDESAAGKEARACLSLIYNAYAFLEMYGAGAKTQGARGAPHVLDAWILGRLGECARGVAEALDAHEIGDAARLIAGFGDDVSRWYLRRSRKRAEALPVLRRVLFETAKLLAPFTPFFAEALYQALGGAQESVHLENWPVIDAPIDTTLFNGMAEIRRVASAALAQRAACGMHIRQPLSALRIRLHSPAQSLGEQTALNRELLEILKEEINVKEIVFDSSLEADFELDTVITPALKAEGLRREAVRMVQGLRQKAGLRPADTVRVFVDADSALVSALQEAEAEFKAIVGATSVVFAESSDPIACAEEDFGGVRCAIGITR